MKRVDKSMSPSEVQALLKAIDTSNKETLKKKQQQSKKTGKK